MKIFGRIFLAALCLLTTVLPLIANSTIIITNPPGSKGSAVGIVNKFHPHGFTEKPYKIFYKMVPIFPPGPVTPPYSPVAFYPEFLIQFKQISTPSSDYEVLQGSRFVNDISVNYQAENLHIYLHDPNVYIQTYRAKFTPQNGESASWKPIAGKVLWEDINGDFTKEIVVFTEQVDNYYSEPFPSFSLELVEDYSITKYGPILNSRTPKVIQTFTKNVLQDHLFNFATMRLKDLNEDGRAELIGKQFKSQGGATKIATPNAAGVFTYTTSSMGDPSPSNTNDCGVKINNMVYGTDYFTNDRCETLFLLPPDSGTVTGKQINFTSSINMCSNVKSTIDAQHEATSEIASLTQELFSIISQQFETAEYKSLLSVKEIAEDKVEELQYAVGVAESKLQYAQDVLRVTEEDFQDGFASESEVASARENVASAEYARENASYQLVVAASTLKVAEANLQSYVENKAEEQNSITESINTLYALNEERRILVKDIYALTGGELMFELKTPWSALVSQTRQSNTNVNINNWQKMPVTSGRVISALPNNIAEYSGILWTRMVDMENQDTFKGDVRYGPVTSPDVHNVETQPILDEAISFPGRDIYRGAMGLSLGALCEHYPNGQTSTMPAAVRDMPKTLGVNLRHNYQFKTASGVRVMYNLGVVSKKIFSHFYRNTQAIKRFRNAFYLHHFYHREPSSRFTGVFHVDRHEIENLVLELRESSWFALRFVDPTISLANQEAIRESVKKQLIDNIFTAVTLEYAKVNQHRNIASAILLDANQLQRFVQYNSQWVNVDAERGVYVTGAHYTDYQ